MTILSQEVLADIHSAAWLEQELHPDLDRHRRHQMADICEPDNADRVWRILGNAIAELRLALLRILSPPPNFLPDNGLQSPHCWDFSFKYPLPASTLDFLREKIHEYLVASVMADRAAVIIPSCADIWRTRAQDTLAALRNAAATAPTTLHPVRRPIYPI